MNAGASFNRATLPIAQFTDIGEPIEGQVNGIPWIEKTALLFYTGTHNGQQYDESDIDRMITATTLPVPLQLAGDRNQHSKSPGNRIGSLTSWWRDGSMLLGRARVYTQQRVDQVKAGLLKGLSISHQENLWVDEITFTNNPVLEHAQIFTQEFSQQLDQVFSQESQQSKESKGDPPMTAQEQKIADEAKKAAELSTATAEKPCDTKNDAEPDSDMDEMKKKKMAKAAADKKAAEASTGSSTSSASHTTTTEYTVPAEFAAKLAEMEQKLAVETNKRLELEARTRTTSIENTVLEYTKAGKILPKDAPDVCKLAMSFSDDQLSAWNKIMKAAPAVIDFKRHSSGAVIPPGASLEDVDTAENRTKVTELSKKYNFEL